MFKWKEYCRKILFKKNPMFYFSYPKLSRRKINIVIFNHVINICHEQKRKKKEIENLVCELKFIT